MLRPFATALRGDSITYLTLSSALLLAACSGGGDGGGGGGGGTPVTGLSQTLNQLGISTQFSPREGLGGQELGTDYSPFGATWSVAKSSELVILGPEVTSTGERFNVLDLTDDDGNASETSLVTRDALAEDWIEDNVLPNSWPQTDRASVGADIDGDGLDEVLVVYMDGGELRLITIQDEAEAFAETDTQLGFELNVTDVTVSAGRLNGDTRDDLVIGLTKDSENAEVLFFQSNSSGFTEFGTRKTYAPSSFSPRTSVEVALGNTDMDAQDEVLIVLNEYFGSGTTADGVSRYTLLDDGNASFAEIQAPMSVMGMDQNSVMRVGINASPLLADVDGDDRAELILATKTFNATSCNFDGYFFMAFEDATEGQVSIANRFFEDDFSNCSSPMVPRVLVVHANALDLDGDGALEIQANQYVFDDFMNAAPWTQPAEFQLSEDVIWEINQTGYFSRTTSSIVTGEFTGDGRDDIAIYRQDTSAVEIWGLAAPDTSINLKRSVATQLVNSSSPLQPILVPANVNVDGPVLSYSDADYRYVFSEPIILAVLAAPPCAEGIGQNTSACFTAFGNTVSSQSAEERTVSVQASSTVGVSVNGGVVTQSSFELQASASSEVSTLTNSAYREARTVLYTTGVAEDTVIFSTIPIDRYTYTVTSHPDPDMVGAKVEVNLPRDPITLQAERNAYNAALEPGALVVDSSVLTHTVGDLSSYPTASEKSQVLSQNGGLQFGPQAVGIGSGSTSLTLQVGEEWGVGGALELGFSLDLAATAGGVLAGYSVGASESSSFTVTSGSETTYTGSVGAIDATNHSQNAFQFGLFTYVRTDPTTGREFEVVQYWIE